MSFTYEYPHPAVCVDIIAFCEANKSILLIKRKHDPFMNSWALPGGFIEMDETLEESAIREMVEETGIKLDKLTQFKTYGDPGRDPRERTVSVVFYVVLDSEIIPYAGDDAADAKWFNIQLLPSLAFDHKIIVHDFISFIT